MLKVEIDAVVKEYLALTMVNLFGRGSEFEITDEIDNQMNERMRESIIMSLLSSAVVFGAVHHNYDKDRKVDEFLYTDRIVKHWGWVFPGISLLLLDRSERYRLEIGGRRSRYFYKGWLSVEEGDLPPAWPS